MDAGERSVVGVLASQALRARGRATPSMAAPPTPPWLEPNSDTADASLAQARTDGFEQIGHRY